jgi:hypothetical protein
MSVTDPEVEIYGRLQSITGVLYARATGAGVGLRQECCGIADEDA